MKIGKFIESQQTTRDTVRYYIEEKLVRPIKKDGNYWFSEKDQADFTAIRELRELGFSIKGIQKVQANRMVHGCGTRDQWASNRGLVVNELSDIDQELARLISRQERLMDLLSILDEKLT